MCCDGGGGGAISFNIDYVLYKKKELCSQTFNRAFLYILS
jgi:hypothetical protein